MGPRSGDRGNAPIRLPSATLSRLQWGRDLVIAEMHVRRKHSAGAQKASMGPRSDDRGNGQVVGYLALSAALQWGRDLVIAEMERSRPGHQRRFSRFNGAAIW